MESLTRSDFENPTGRREIQSFDHLGGQRRLGGHLVVGDGEWPVLVGQPHEIRRNEVGAGDGSRHRSFHKHMLYHMVVARREVLVQLDDDLVARLDELARRVEVSRSELLRRGAVTVLEAARLTEADERLIEAYTKQPPDAALLEASQRLAAETVPEW